MSVSAALNAPNIELIPGSGFSINRVLNIVCNVWQPSNSRGAGIKSVLCNFTAAAFDPAAQAALCETLFPDGADDELERALSEAMSFASAEVLQVVGQPLGLGGDCMIACSSGGVSASVDAGAVFQQVIEFGLAAFGGDGIDWGGLVSEAVDFALTQAVCCVVTLAADLAAKAAAAAGALNVGAIVAQLRQQCNNVLVAGGQSPEGSAPTPGWGPAATPAPTSTPEPTTAAAAPAETPWWVWQIIATAAAAAAANKDANASPIVAETAVLPPPPPPPPQERKNWLPLAVTFAGVGVATILITRGKAPRRLLRRRTS